MRNALGLIVGLWRWASAVAAISRAARGPQRRGVGAGPRPLGCGDGATAERGHRSAAPTAGARLGAEGEAEHEPSLPPELAGLELLAAPYGTDEVGVIEDRAAGTFTAALAVRAGAFAMRDSAEQERALDAWGAVLASCARDGSPIRRLQWIEQTLPGEGDELAAHFQAQRDRAVPLDSELVRSYIELVESAGAGSDRA